MNDLQLVQDRPNCCGAKRNGQRRLTDGSHGRLLAGQRQVDESHLSVPSVSVDQHAGPVVDRIAKVGAGVMGDLTRNPGTADSLAPIRQW